MDIQTLTINLAKDRIQKWIGKTRTLSTAEISAKLKIRQRVFRAMMEPARVRQDRQRRWVTAEVCEVLVDAIDNHFIYDPLKDQWSEWATTYCLGELDLFEGTPQTVYIKAQPQINGPIKWSINTPETNGWCLSKDLEWVWEPKPGDRTEEYFHNTRYNSKGEALAMLKRFREEKEKALLYF
jgi:hypothetical protein